MLFEDQFKNSYLLKPSNLLSLFYKQENTPSEKNVEKKKEETNPLNLSSSLKTSCPEMFRNPASCQYVLILKSVKKLQDFWKDSKKSERKQNKGA